MNLSKTHQRTPIDRILSLWFLSSMQTISYTEARNQLATLMDSAIRDRKPITITRNGEGKVVMMSAEEFTAMEETLHLLSTPANSERIRQGLSDYKAGKIRKEKLCL